MATPRVIHGDSLTALTQLDDNSIDAVVTDPPYGLSALKPDTYADVLTHWAGGDDTYMPQAKGFMGKSWDGFVPPPALWKECLRVLKPGGHLLSFSGTRTQDLMGISIRLSGFEIRESVAWLFGSGFPKSHNLKGDWEGFGTALKPAFEPVVVARKPLAGTVAANVLKFGTGALNIDACRIESGADYHDLRVTQGGDHFSVGSAAKTRGTVFTPHAGRWPANVVLDEHTAQLLDKQSGNRPGAVSDGSKTANGMNGTDTFRIREREQKPGYADQGGASRFFYVAKATKRERPVYETPDGQKIQHATVKPLALMRWLVRLVTPPNGTVLDPFAGSGTTIEAALLEGFDVIGIERETEYLPLIQQRIDRVGNTLI